jgi:hypothetical protein
MRQMDMHIIVAYFVTLFALATSPAPSEPPIRADNEKLKLRGKQKMSV